MHTYAARITRTHTNRNTNANMNTNRNTHQGLDLNKTYLRTWYTVTNEQVRVPRCNNSVTVANNASKPGEQGKHATTKPLQHSRLTHNVHTLLVLGDSYNTSAPMIMSAAGRACMRLLDRLPQSSPSCNKRQRQEHASHPRTKHHGSGARSAQPQTPPVPLASEQRSWPRCVHSCEGPMAGRFYLWRRSCTQATRTPLTATQPQPPPPQRSCHGATLDWPTTVAPAPWRTATQTSHTSRRVPAHCGPSRQHQAWTCTPTQPDRTETETWQGCHVVHHTPLQLFTQRHVMRTHLVHVHPQRRLPCR